MFFFSLLLIDCLAFFIWLVVPLAFHFIFLPLSFAHSKELGLGTALLWTCYYFVEALLSRSQFHVIFKTLLNPIITLLPILQHLSIIPPIPFLLFFQSPTLILLFEYVLIFSLPVFAILESIATILLIKRGGAFLKHSEIPDWGKWLFLILLVSLYIFALSTWYQLYITESLSPNAMVFAILCLLLSHLIIIHIPFISSPGENDVPMAEGFFLFFYVTYCIQVCALPHSPQMPMTSPLPFKNLDYGFRLSHLLDLIKSDALNTYVYPWLRWFITMFTWFSTPWIIRLVFRTFVFSATTHMLASHARVYPPQHSFLKFSFSYLQVLYKPFLMMYYAHTLLLLFNWVTDLTYATQWLSLVTSIFFYACFLCI